jgi:hypothetical protein
MINLIAAIFCFIMGLGCAKNGGIISTILCMILALLNIFAYMAL